MPAKPVAVESRPAAPAPRSFLRARKTRRLGLRRFALLSAVIALPAMAAPSMDSAAEAPTVRIRLADVPETGLRPAAAPAHQEAVPAAPAAGPVARLVPAAASWSVSGSITDVSRARQCLAMAVYYEAASESVDGQRAVAQVVMNRVRHPSYPNNVCGVVFQGSERSTGCQFSFTCDGSLARRPDAAGWRRAESVADAALDGFVFEPVGLATHYHAAYVDPHWAASLDPVTRIGLHQFYRWRGSAGLQPAFVADYRGGEPLPGRLLANADYPARATTNPAAAPPAVPGTVLPAAEPAPVLATRPVEAATPAAAPVAALNGHEDSGRVHDRLAQSGHWLPRP